MMRNTLTCPHVAPVIHREIFCLLVLLSFDRKKEWGVWKRMMWTLQRAVGIPHDPSVPSVFFDAQRKYYLTFTMDPIRLVFPVISLFSNQFGRVSIACKYSPWNVRACHAPSPPNLSDSSTIKYLYICHRPPNDFVQ